MVIPAQRRAIEVNLNFVATHVLCDVSGVLGAIGACDNDGLRLIFVFHVLILAACQYTCQYVRLTFSRFPATSDALSCRPIHSVYAGGIA